MTLATDYYELLGVDPNASAEELKSAYRRLARQLHPDANPDDPEAESRFKEVSVAYATLSDPERRARYDQFGPDADGSDASGFGNVNDIFEAFFGSSSPFGQTARQGPTGPPRGSDLEAVIELDFTEAVFGGEHEVSVRTFVACPSCEGSGGASGSAPERCVQCDGAGQVRRVRQSILGQMVTASTCPSCGGIGKVITALCEECGGEGRRAEVKTYQVKVPAGVDHGSTLRLTGRGAAGPRGGRPGDLYIHVRVAPHHRFVRDGDDVYGELRIGLAQASLGVRLPYETLDGDEELAVAPGTQPGGVIRLRGKGVPRAQGRGRGDLIVSIVVDIPADLSREQDELLRQYATERGEPVADPSERGLLGKLRSAFK